MSEARRGVTALRGTGWVLLALGVLGAAALLVLRQVTVIHTWHEYLIAAASFIPLIWLPLLVAALGLVLLLRARWRLLAAALTLVLVAVTAWPMLPGPERSATPQVVPEGTLTVLSSNIEYGGADIDEIARLAEQGVDAIALQEVTPEFEEALETSGLLEAFPHHVGTARDDAVGTMLLSRTPVELVDSMEGAVFDNLLATTTVDGTLWHLAVIHTAPPQMGAESWTADAAAVGEMVAPYAEENLLLVGDFNAIEQHHTMRELTADGSLRSLVAPGRGRGEGLWEPTWPVGRSVPPFARIDHALVGPGVEGPVPNYLTIPGTDHKALRVQVSPVAQGAG
ncbi:endonuclease/exonuclease/phosphatase family protein [Brachybacterium paraconglomeratum]|uniref:endonuclease/exonuclease/phosphatase family protein n=1 Tax=Brachybacterium paraconglomeratum TaxID=173362 RepID=UPI0022AEF654|nr:endonuclease/exonuclease/phosphatase family protein [Brachybacterium paraconglomeratum]MCZ4324933.1 endonuclease/exonuclease/phosphatase family protein [Brachybacterium paraconglomeratum]